MPEISVIIPVYNVEKYLEKCLNSILSQTYSDFEVICVNDGSPDKCKAILKRYAKEDKRVRIITQKNQGVSVARYNGLKKAKGHFISFIDSDDEVASTFLEELYRAVREEKADFSWCDYTEGKNADFPRKENLKSVSYTEAFDCFIHERPKMVYSLVNKLYRKDLFRNIYSPKEQMYAEDLVVLYQLMYRAKKAVYVPQILYFYRQRETSAMHALFNQKIIDGNIQLACFMHDYFEKAKLSDSLRRTINQKVAKRIFKFCVLEPKRKDKAHYQKWYAYTRPVLQKLKESGYYQPQCLSLKNRIKSVLFLKGGLKNA